MLSLLPQDISLAELRWLLKPKASWLKFLSSELWIVSVLGSGKLDECIYKMHTAAAGPKIYCTVLAQFMSIK